MNANQRKRLEDLAHEYTDLDSWFKGLKPKMRLTARFKSNWERLLDYYEKRLLILAEGEVNQPHHARKLVARGWSYADLKRRILIHSKDDPGDVPKIAIVLQNSDGQWHPPTSLSMTARLHPVIDKISRQLEPLSSREEIELKKNWALSLKEGKDENQLNQHERMLAQAANSLDLMMYIPMGVGEEMSWLHRATETESFWHILQSAIEFGKRLALYDVYGDGVIEDLTKAAIINPPGKKPSPWQPLLEAQIKEQRREGNPVTPLALFKALGGEKHKVSDSEPSTFSDARTEDLPPISWTKFRAVAKNLQQKGR